jgi:hypothetical protein
VRGSTPGVHADVARVVRFVTPIRERLETRSIMCVVQELLTVEPS